MFQEHERDWSIFQMEWAYLPELCVMTHGALALTERVVSGLIVYPEAMLRNLNASGGLMLAERVMLTLGASIGRQHAHDVVYDSAMRAFEERRPFADVLKEDSRVTDHLSAADVDALLDPIQYTGLSGVFVDRVLGS
jgi:3-carboxy-cis,cis-muconate cycloisomerase